MSATNPNGVNQYTAPDPRQALFLQLYLDRESDTFSNVYRSALKAGYEDEYAQNVSGQMPKWLSEAISDNDLLNKAVEVLRDCLKYDESTDTKIRVRQDTAKFLAETVGKNRFSKRTEMGVDVLGRVEIVGVQVSDYERFSKPRGEEQKVIGDKSDIAD